MDLERGVSTPQLDGAGVARPEILAVERELDAVEPEASRDVENARPAVDDGIHEACLHPAPVTVRRARRSRAGRRPAVR